MIIELSHEIVAGMTTYPGLAAPRLRIVTSRESSAARLGDGACFEIEELTLVGNTGTYLDAPFHYHADRPDMAQLPAQRLVNVPIIMVRAYGHRTVTAEQFGDAGRLWGTAVLIHTGWARHWGTPAYHASDSPHLSADAVDTLIAANVALVGIDSLNIDDPADPRRPAHHGLLGVDIPIIEHLTNLDAVPDIGARLIALPAPVQGMASFPVRAVAVVEP